MLPLEIDPKRSAFSCGKGLSKRPRCFKQLSVAAGLCEARAVLRLAFASLRQPGSRQAGLLGGAAWHLGCFQIAFFVSLRAQVWLTAVSFKAF